MSQREELESYIDEIEGDLEVQSLLSPEKRLPAASIKALNDSLAKARDDLATLDSTPFQSMDVYRNSCIQHDDSFLLCAMSGGDLYGEVQIAPGRESFMLVKVSLVPGPICGLGPVDLTLRPNEILVFRYDWTMPGLVSGAKVMWGDFYGGAAEFKVKNVLTNVSREIDRAVGLDILERLVVIADLGNRPIPGGDLYAPSLIWLLVSGGAWAWNPECDVPASIKEVCS